MKKIFCILLFLPLLVDAQDSLSRVSVGISFSNDWCYRMTSADGSLSELKNEFDSLEVSRYGFTAGVYAAYWLSENISLQAGVSFADRGYAIDTLESVGITNLRFHYRYIEIPLRVNYIFRNTKKMQPVAGLGLYADYLVGNKVSYEQASVSSDSFFDDTKSLSKMNFGVSISFGLQKEIQSGYTFQVEGIFRQSLTSVSSTSFKRYLNAVGISLSLVRRF